MTVTKKRMKVAAVPAHPLVALIRFVQSYGLFMLFSLQTTFKESDQLMVSTKGYSYDKGSGLS